MHSRVTDDGHDLRCEFCMYHHVKLVEFTTLRNLILSSDSHMIWFCSLMVNSDHE